MKMSSSIIKLLVDRVNMGSIERYKILKQYMTLYNTGAATQDQYLDDMIAFTGLSTYQLLTMAEIAREVPHLDYFN